MNAARQERSTEDRERDRLRREQKRMLKRGGPSPSAPPAAHNDPSPSAPPAAQNDPPPPAPVETSPPRRAHGNRIGAIALAAAALVIVWLVFAVFQPFAGDGKGQGAVQIQIPRGADVHEIGALLAASKVVDSARVFSWRAGQSGKSNDFKAGDYRFERGMSYSAAINLLADGPNVSGTTITVIEGRSRHEIAQQAARLGIDGDYMAASKSSRLLNPRHYGASRSTDSLEGFLFPATYDLTAGMTAKRLVAQQLRAFKSNFGSVNMSYAHTKNLHVFDVVTIASLIEREVQLPRERRLVAAVIYNRLKRGIALGIDATTRFETNNWTEPLTAAQLTMHTPYNTRTRRGLPPGPIGNPGMVSLRAAAHPAKVGYVYYVANPCKPGSHSFSSTYAQFQQDVQRYRLARDAAGGKQPGGC